jgi:ribosomal protein S18 acetylase RimI-like enzyme
MLNNIVLSVVREGVSEGKARSGFLPDAFELRPARNEDQPFMEELFRGTREFLYRMPLPRSQIDILVSQQYQLQQNSYAQRFPRAGTLIIERLGRSIGKIVLDERTTAVHIIDFALEPAMRGKGYGTQILCAIQAAARERRMSVELSVDNQNVAAKKLYLRLGFQATEASDSHEFMVWTSSLAPSQVASSTTVYRAREGGDI